MAETASKKMNTGAGRMAIGSHQVGGEGWHTVQQVRLRRVWRERYHVSGSTMLVALAGNPYTSAKDVILPPCPVL